MTITTKTTKEEQTTMLERRRKLWGKSITPTTTTEEQTTMLERRRRRQRQEESSNVICINKFDEDLSHLLHPPSIDDALAAEVADAAKSRVDQIRFLRGFTNDTLLPSLNWSDIRIQRIMGVGGFAAVSLVRVPKLDDRQQGPPSWYALKCLNKDTMMDARKNKNKFLKAVRDLYIEAAMLSRLRHKNIIQIHGAMKGSNSNTFQQPGGYFLVLQCMKRTLDEMLRTWQNDPNLTPSMDYRVSTIGLGIASAMEYLHENHILYRDLKPHNVGIDYNGHVRLFDFGIAKELPEGKHMVHGCVGSLRYMAPEILVHHEASMASDVYAFGILLWQLVVLQKPYGGTSLTYYQQFREQVGSGNARPEPMPDDGSLSNLIEASWNQEPGERPTFSMIVQSLKPKEEEIFRPSVRTFLANTFFGRQNRRRVMQAI
jgi:serine/threonine protein kinase